MGSSAVEGKQYWELGPGKRDLSRYASRDAHETPCTCGRAQRTRCPAHAGERILCSISCMHARLLDSAFSFVSWHSIGGQRKYGALMAFRWYHWDSVGICNGQHFLLSSFILGRRMTVSVRSAVVCRSKWTVALGISRFRVCLR